MSKIQDIQTKLNSIERLNSDVVYYNDKLVESVRELERLWAELDSDEEYQKVRHLFTEDSV